MEQWLGAKATIKFTVMATDTAIEVGSGNLPVLATPRLIAVCEAATVEAVSSLMPEGKTSVGISVAVEHLQASAIGQEVVVAARLESVEQRKLNFWVEARQSGEVVMSGQVRRALVDTDRFMNRLSGD